VALTVTVSIEHRTRYGFDRPVGLGPHEIRLRPAPSTTTPVHGYSLAVIPVDHALTWFVDALGNQVARATFPAPATELQIEVGLTATLTPGNPFDFFVEPEAQTWPPRYDEPTRHDLQPFLGAPQNTSRFDERLAALTAGASSGTPTIDYLVALNASLAGEIAYTTREEPGVQSPEQSLELSRGSCRDSSWLLIELLRGLGVAARFTSGYLIQLQPTPGMPDSVDLHAWAEVYIPGAGWIGLDPTSGLLTGEGHLPLAVASSPPGAAPVIGSHSDARTTLTHTMAITRVSS
jgi:transglutaminase-like putative cysteine protease